MSYASIASQVKSSHSSFVSYVSSNFKPDQLAAIWSGPAATTNIDEMKKTINNVNTNSAFIDSFVQALNDLDTYKSKKELIASKTETMTPLRREFENTEKIKKNEEKLNSLANQINTLQTEINTLETEAAALKVKINNALSKVSSISSTAVVKTSVQTSTVDLGSYADKIQTLMAKGKSLPSMYGSLYKYYSKEEVANIMNQVKQQYSGREAAVNSALTIIELAANVGKKLDYKWGGGHVHNAVTTLDHVANGTDCSAFASWAVQQGATTSFPTTTAAYLCNRGQRVDYAYAQAGDILVCGSHACLIVANDPEGKYFITAEETGGGAVVKKRTYSSVKGQYQVRDLSQYY